MKISSLKKTIFHSFILLFFLSPLSGEEKPWVNIHPVPPALSDEQFQRFYEMLEIVSAIFEKEQIEYFAEGKTLLGAVRHGGFIPWDPHLDFVISMNYYPFIVGLTDHLAAYNLEVVKHPLYQYRLAIKDTALDLSFEIHFYWLSTDLFGRKKLFLAEHRFQYMNPDYFFYEEVYPLKTKAFGKSTISIPNKPESYLTRRYGKHWETTALTETKHNGHFHKFIIQDFSPYPDHHHTQFNFN